MQQPNSSAPDVGDATDGGTPGHVAIIMDGNNRWAKHRGLPGHEGHRAGEKAVQRVIRGCLDQGVGILTLFAFSSENWRRPEDEVRHLMALFLNALSERVGELQRHKVRLRFIGERSAFSEPLQQAMAVAEAATAEHQALTLVVAANYGGQWDMARAAQRLAEQVAAGTLTPAQVTAEAMQAEIELGDLPPPDLLIRTGGEYRLSNFLLWQAAYSELYFSPALWPDFDEQALAEAIAAYAGRQRRFGRSGDQIETLNGRNTTC